MPKVTFALLYILMIAGSLGVPAGARAQEIEAEIRKVGLAGYLDGLLNSPGPMATALGADAKMQFAQKVEALRGKELKNLEVATIQPLSYLKIVIIAADFGDNATIASLVFATNGPQPQPIGMTVRPIPDGLSDLFSQQCRVLPEGKLPRELIDQVTKALKASLAKQDFGAFANLVATQAKEFDHVPPYLDAHVRELSDPSQKDVNVVFRTLQFEPAVTFVSTRKITKDLQCACFLAQSSFGPVVFPVFVLTHGERHLIVGYGFEAGSNALTFFNDLRRLEDTHAKK